MDERGGWMPWLDLLAEDELDSRGVSRFNNGKDRAMEGFEHFGRELRGSVLTGVVEY